MNKYNSVAHAMIIALSIISLPIYSELNTEHPVDAGLHRALEVDIDSVHAQLIKTQEMRFCYISFVRINGKEYIVKQKKSDCFRKIVGVVRDAITAHIAQDFGIAHRVAIIPAGKKFVGKPRTDWPATLHTIAPGKMIKAQNSKYDGMNIKQADMGFRPDMLVWMMKHPTLIKMVALDTFVCNHDRHRGNLFYHRKTDSFCAIDMDSAFKYNLCELACKNFTAMINDTNLRLSTKEIHTLTSYKDHIKFLIDRHHPEQTLEQYDAFIQAAGFIQGSSLYTPKIALEIESNKAIITQSYTDAKRLIPILEELIEVSKKRQKELL